MLKPLINDAILQHDTFAKALIYRLATKLAGKILPSEFFLDVFHQCLESAGDEIERLAIEDLVAVEKRDPACTAIVQVLLYFKGYKSIQCYRFAHALWKRDRKDLAMVIQARCTEVFGVDIHPGAVIGGGLMIDHGTGVVIGETVVVGKNCSFLHGITLGGTGNSTEFDRHPKLGDNVFLGCNVTVLGNIRIGSNSRVGASSLVLKSLPSDCTAMGSPATIRRQITSSGSSVSLFDENRELDSPPDVTIDSDVRAKRKQFELEGREGHIQLWEETWAPKVWKARMATVSVDVDPSCCI